VLTSCQLDALAGARVFLKCENLQRAGVVLTGGNVEWLQPWPRLAGCGKTISARENFDGPHVRHNRRTLVQDAQKMPLSKAAAPRLTLVSRFTPHVSRFLGAISGLRV